MSSLQGKLLLAAPVMEDPNFARSVVLVISHNDDGAMGLILNRPTGATVREAIEESGDVSCQTDAGLFRGGPCDGPLMVLHSEVDLAQETVISGPPGAPGTGVYFTVESELVRDLLTSPETTARYFHGYAGWSPGQLDAELDAGGWLIVEASSKNVFDPDMGSQAWTARLNERTREELKGQINPNLIPPDPSVN